MTEEEKADVTVVDKMSDLRDLVQTIPQEETQESNMMEVFRVATQKGYAPADITALMELAERYDKHVSRKAFFRAVSQFKAVAPVLEKDRYNEAFNSYYTSLGLLLTTYNPILAQFGLSISFPIPENTDVNSMVVTCRLSHEEGHYEEIAIRAPIDEAAKSNTTGKRARNSIQDVKSTFTYLRSITCEAILGVSGTEATLDDDGNAAGEQKEKINEEQLGKLRKLIKETGTKEEKVAQFFKVKTLEDLPLDTFGKAMNMLQDKKKEKKKGD